MRRLIILLLTNAISTTGTAVILISLPLFVLASGGNGAQTGLVAAAETAGLATAALLGGPLIDKLGGRGVAIWSDVLAGTTIAAIPLLRTVGVDSIWVLALCGALFGLTRAPGQTARQVLLAWVIRDAIIGGERATSINEGAARLGRMIGAALAGLLVALVGAVPTLLVAAACFACAGGALLAVRMPTTGSPDEVRVRNGYLTELVDGLRYLRQDRLIASIVALVMVTNLIDAAASSVLFPVYADRVLRSPVALGVMVGTFAGCALLGALLFAVVGPRMPRWATYTVVMLIGGAPRLLVLGLDPGLPLIVATMAVSGLAFGAVNPLLFAVCFERIPDAMLSRVMSTISACVLLGSPIGAIAGGLATDALGIHAAVTIAGAVYLAATLCPLLFRDTWRGMDRTPAPAPATADSVRG